MSLQFFQKRGVSEAISTYDLFNAVTGLNIPVGAEDEAEFMAEVTQMLQVDDPQLSGLSDVLVPVKFSWGR